MRRTGLIGLVVIAVWALPTAGDAETVGAANMKLEATIEFASGTDLAFKDDLAFVGSLSSNPEQSGMRIIDISDPDDPVVIGRFPCAGSQNDVGVWRDTAILGMHSSGSTEGCTPVNQGGLRLIDITDPTTPTQTAFVEIPGTGVHTFTVVGDTGYVYATPGGIVLNPEEFAITIVDIRDKHNPEIVGTFTPPNSTGCHDTTVVGDRAYCAGSEVTQIWDITDPLAPSVISQIVNPLMTYHHGAVPSPDGNLLVLADEAFGVHVCEPGGRSPLGAFWIYDISNEQVPVLQGYISQTQLTQVSTLFTEWCTAHNFNFVPDRNWMVAASYTGGTTVIDLTDPMNPEVKGWLIPDGADTWSSYFYKGFIYTGDLGRGFDVISIDELRPPEPPLPKVKGKTTQKDPLPATGVGGESGALLLTLSAVGVAGLRRRALA